MSATIPIPVWVLLTAGALAFVLCLVTFIAVTAWFGLSKMIEDERARTHLLRVDVYEDRERMRRIEGRP